MIAFAPDPAVTGDEVLAWIAGALDALGASAGVVCLSTLDGEAIKPVWSVGYPEDVVVKWRRINLQLATPLTDAVRTNTLVTVSTVAEVVERYPALAVTLIAGQTAQAAVPLAGPGEAGVLGVLGLSFPSSQALEPVRAGLLSLGERLSQRLWRVGTPFAGRLMTSDPDHDPTGNDSSNLHRLAAHLLGAVTPEEVLDMVGDHGAPLLEADMVNIMLLEPAGRSLRLVTSRNVPDHVTEHFSTIAVDAPYPSRDALARDEGVYLRSRLEHDQLYRAVAEADHGAQAMAVLPLRGRTGPLGVISFGWATHQVFDERERGAISQVADLCAAALERAEWYAVQRHARLQAEGTAERLRQMQALIRELSQAPSPEDVALVVASTARAAIGAQASSVTIYDGTHPEQHIAWVGMPTPAAAAAVPRFGELAIVAEMLTTRQPVLVSSIADRDARYPDMAGSTTGHEAWVNLPLTVGDRFVGTAAFGWVEPQEFEADEIEFITSLTTHAAIALDRALLLEGARATAETLQRALLPEIAPIEGWDIATRYIPAVEGTRVGGDWYDVFALPGGKVGLALGDVAGKGVRAAAIMGAVRSALRAYATVNEGPAEVLRELDAYSAAFISDQMVTLCYAVLDPVTGSLTYASAGHPPPLHLSIGTSNWLTEATTAPIGVLRDVQRSETTVMLAAPGEAAALLLYSDGLIERRGESIWNGLSALREAAVDVASAPDLQSAIDDMVKQVEHPNRTVDDLAILAVRRWA